MFILETFDLKKEDGHHKNTTRLENQKYRMKSSMYFQKQKVCSTEQFINRLVFERHEFCRKQAQETFF